LVSEERTSFAQVLAEDSASTSSKLDQFIQAHQLQPIDLAHKRVESGYSGRVLLCLLICITLSLPLVVWFSDQYLRNLETKNSTSEARNKFRIGDRVMYEWEQSSTFISFYAKIPAGCSQHNIAVTLSPQSVALGRKAKPAFLNERLFGTIDPTTSSWHLTTNGQIELHLNKVGDGPDWPCIFLAHQPLDCEKESTAAHQPSGRENEEANEESSDVVSVHKF